MISSLLPLETVTVEKFGVNELDLCLMPEEMSIALNWMSPRRAEFATARRCAHEALVALGAPSVAITQGRHGEPIWPRGVVGSITHCQGFRAASVAWQVEILGLGIDAEPARSITDEVLGFITNASEREAIFRGDVCSEDTPWGTVVFSAKEAAFKALHSFVSNGFDFTQIQVSLESERNIFHAGIRVNGGPETAPRLHPVVHGRFRIVHGFILTTAIIYRDRPSFHVGDSCESCQI